MPPSTTTSSPVMNHETSHARKSTTRAISSVDPRRRCGILASSAVRTAAAASTEYTFSRIPESVGPGLTTFTRTPCSASSDVAVRANERRWALDAGLQICTALHNVTQRSTVAPEFCYSPGYTNPFELPRSQFEPKVALLIVAVAIRDAAAHRRINLFANDVEANTVPSRAGR
jgi:hypothetical protein